MSITNCMYLIILVISVTLLVGATSEPTDLGTFGSHNDLPNSISSYSIPANVEERQTTTVETFVLAFINYTYIDDGVINEFAEEKGKYGEGKILNVYGKLVHVTRGLDVSDHTGCDPFLKGTNGNPLPLYENWIALIKRGNCNFEDKVKNAWLNRAVGVIIYNDKETGSLDKMKITDRERNITAVFTFKWLGENMARLVDGGIELNVSISEGRHAKPQTNINRTSVLFVSISFIVLMIISLVWLVFYYVQRYRYLQTKDRKMRHMCSVAKRIISKIPTKSIKSDDNEIENDCCAICIEPYKTTEIIRMLPCRHDFHKSCIDPWLMEHRTCPMCKMDILKHYGFVFTGSEESILQLDLDTEIVDNMQYQQQQQQHQQHRSGEIIRSRSVTPPTYTMQFNHEQHNRRSSIDSIVSIGFDDSKNCEDGNKIGAGDTANSSNDKKSKCIGCTSKHYSIDDDYKDNKFENIPESRSLPCTLKKCKSYENCRGNNNCYVWTLDNEEYPNRKQQQNKKLNNKLEKMNNGAAGQSAVTSSSSSSSSSSIITTAVTKSKIHCDSDISNRNQTSDNELLLSEKLSDSELDNSCYCNNSSNKSNNNNNNCNTYRDNNIENNDINLPITEN